MYMKTMPPVSPTVTTPSFVQNGQSVSERVNAIQLSHAQQEAVGSGKGEDIQTNQSTLDIVCGPLDEHTQRPDDTQCCGTVEEHRAAETAPLNAGDVKAAPL